MDALVRISTKKAGQLIELGADSVGFAIAASIAVLGTIGAWDSYTSGTIVYKSVVFPEWWILSMMPVSMAFLAVEFLRRIMQAGCASYRVFFGGRKAMYFGRDGAFYTEPFPAQGQ